ncbi:MAG: type II toxin-antitoxin system VapC family toxin [Betaproteobacteria bacterium]|nr:type II toxin-antitoxin system VapC family toxin [Betaproteobacteria bacterium]
MNVLLDTNVVSEFARPKPQQAVLEWLRQVPPDALYVSVLTLGELRDGVERLSASTRREQLKLWLERDVRPWFGSRVLPVDAAVADRWGRLCATMKRPLPAVDSLLAATALEHGLRLVTRDVGDFDLPGLEVVNPWAL